MDYASFRIQFGKLIRSHQLGQKLLAKEFTTSRMRETVAWCRELFGGNGIVMDYGVMKYFADAEAIYSYEGTREMNTLIVGRAITGKAAFV